MYLYENYNNSMQKNENHALPPGKSTGFDNNYISMFLGLRTDRKNILPICFSLEATSNGCECKLFLYSSDNENYPTKIVWCQISVLTIQCK